MPSNIRSSMGTDIDRKGQEEEGLMGSMSDNHILSRKNTTREAAASLLSSYFSKRFMSGWYVFI